MSAIILRGGVELENPLELTLELVTAYSSTGISDSSGPSSFDESDLRLANRGDARISAAEIAVILERRGEIERGLGGSTRMHPWRTRRARSPGSRRAARRRVRGHPGNRFLEDDESAAHMKRPALIPMLDSVVQAT
jgi:hypothetical protein